MYVDEELKMENEKLVSTVALQRRNLFDTELVTMFPPC